MVQTSKEKSRNILYRSHYRARVRGSCEEHFPSFGTSPFSYDILNFSIGHSVPRQK